MNLKLIRKHLITQANSRIYKTTLKITLRLPTFFLLKDLLNRNRVYTENNLR